MKKIDSFVLRFWLEIGTGLATLLAVLIIGEAGFAVSSLFAITAFLKRRKLDERETQLFHRANTLTLGLVYLSMFPVYFFFPAFNWLIALFCSFLFFHGLCNLLLYKFGSVGGAK
ncbi:MAG: hypothetical protein PHI34_13745 [Acidobacteriota bacterium]|nr:hypothetical protein [Acidobacteriota bacterium]